MIEEYGEIVDIPFPDVNPRGSNEYINSLVEEFYDKVIEYDNPVVMLQGEFIFTYRLVCKLKANNIKVVASCSERKTVEYTDKNGCTTKQSIFEFVDFKEY